MPFYNHKPRITQLIPAIPRYPPAKSHSPKVSPIETRLPYQVHKPLPPEDVVSLPPVDDDTDDDITIEDIKIVSKGTSLIKTEMVIKTEKCIKTEAPATACTLNSSVKPISANPTPCPAETDKLVSSLISSVGSIKAGSITHYRKSGIVVSSPDFYQLPSNEDIDIPRSIFLKDSTNSKSSVILLPNSLIFFFLIK